MILYIVRHGDPDYEHDSLTEIGKLQAKAVAKRLYASGVNKVYSSPMGRARMTAEPLCALLGCEYTVEDWTRELNEEEWFYDDGTKRIGLAGIRNTMFRDADNLDLGYNEAYFGNIVSKTGLYERYKIIDENSRDFLSRLGYVEEGGIYKAARPNDDKVALFCHGGFLRVFLSKLLHFPIHLMMGGILCTPTGVSVVEFANYPDRLCAPKLRCFSDMSHIYADENLEMRHDKILI